MSGSIRMRLANGMVRVAPDAWQSMKGNNLEQGETFSLVRAVGGGRRDERWQNLQRFLRRWGENLGLNQTEKKEQDLKTSPKAHYPTCAFWTSIIQSTSLIDYVVWWVTKIALLQELSDDLEAPDHDHMTYAHVNIIRILLPHYIPGWSVEHLKTPNTKLTKHLGSSPPKSALRTCQTTWDSSSLP